MLTLEEALKSWEQAGHHGTREQRIARGSRDKHRKAMMAALGIHPQGGMTTEALH